MQSEVTVGIPTYNNAATLKRAVMSVLGQTRPPRQILISDNASSDDTFQVAMELVNMSSTIEYVRHSTNVGHVDNFGSLLCRCSTDYFMWLAADDYILPTYIEETARVLEQQPDATTCVSLVDFVSHDGSHSPATGGQPLRGRADENIAAYLSDPGANARVYGLHRADALRQAFPVSHFHAFDWALMAGTLLKGKHYQVPKTLMIRDYTPQSSYVRQVRADNARWIMRVFPLMPMTTDLLWRQRIPITKTILRALLKSNLFHHCIYTQIYHPLYYRVFGRRIRDQLWKLD